MNSIRALTIVQFVCLAVWVVGMIALFVASGPARWIWLALWVFAMVVFFVSFWRAMWLRTSPTRRDARDAG